MWESRLAFVIVLLVVDHSRGDECRFYVKSYEQIMIMIMIIIITVIVTKIIFVPFTTGQKCLSLGSCKI